MYFYQIVRHPFYFLFIDLDPTYIDVNIHTTKNEIRFEDESTIDTILLNSIQRALGAYNIKTDSTNLKLDANYNPLFNLYEGFNISTKNLYEQIQLSQSTNNIDLCKNGIFQ